MALRRLTGSILRKDVRYLFAFNASPAPLEASQMPSAPSGSVWIIRRSKRSYVKKLVDCFESEIRHEEENYETDEIVKQGPPNEFKLLDMEDNCILLHKEYNGEDITVKASFTEQPMPEKENPEDPESAVSHTIVLTVLIKKKGSDHQLILECETDGGYMSINHAGLEPVSGTAKISDYTGPAFGELDDTLQDTFNNWLEERGVDDVLGDYLVQKIHDTEQQNYQEWLAKTKTFLEAGM